VSHLLTAFFKADRTGQVAAQKSLLHESVTTRLGGAACYVQTNYLSFGHEGSQPFSQHRLVESRQAALLTICAASWNFGLAAKVEV
jgi:hypothetical protein